MSVSSTSAAGAAPASGGIDPISPEQANARAVTGFELLLADAQAPDANSSSSNSSDGGQNDSKPTDGTTGTDAPPPPPAKPPAEGDSTGLAGALGAPMPPPVAIPDPTAPPAGDPTATPVTDVTDAPPPTVLDLVAAALTPDPTASDASPADPATPPAVATDLSALLEQAPRPAAAATPPLDYAPSAPSAPSPSAITADAIQAKATSPTPASTSSRPSVVDSAGPAPSDRPRPQAASSAAPSSAATFTPPPPPTTPVGGTAAEELTTATATVAPPPPAEQLVSVLTPLRTSPTGTYTLRLELKPPEMGRVEMRVEMRDGVLHASIHAEREGAAQLVRDSLSDLRDRLNSEGVRTGDLTVSDGGVGPGSRDGEDGAGARSTASATTGTASDDPALPEQLPSSFDTETTSLLDVRV